MLFACAPATHHQALYIAPTHKTVTTRLEASNSGRGQHIMVENRSTVEIIVTGVQLRECENIKNQCAVQRLRKSVRPGQQVRVATVEVANPEQRSNFRYSWTWEVAPRTAESEQ
jgi:hypothetical protein